MSIRDGKLAMLRKTGFDNITSTPQDAGVEVTVRIRVYDNGTVMLGDRHMDHVQDGALLHCAHLLAAGLTEMNRAHKERIADQ